MKLLCLAKDDEFKSSYKEPNEDSHEPMPNREPIRGWFKCHKGHGARRCQYFDILDPTHMQVDAYRSQAHSLQ
jgi:hypothetical protein